MNVLHRVLAAGSLICLAAGCGPTNTPVAPPVATPPAPGTVLVVRSPDAEMALSETGHKAWAYKTDGGLATVEFLIYHRPAGKDQPETIVHRMSGDDTLAFLSVLPEAEGKSSEAIVGMVTVVVPESLGDVREIRFGFSMAGGRSDAKTTSDKVFPASVRKYNGWLASGSETTQPILLAPGETKSLVDTRRLLGSEGPFEERESVRYVLTITALKDGKIPAERGEAAAK